MGIQFLSQRYQATERNHCIIRLFSNLVIISFNVPNSTLFQESPKIYKRFAVTFVNILKQIMDFRLSNDFTYYNVPAPWIQIKLLRILAYLGHEDQRWIIVGISLCQECFS